MMPRKSLVQDLWSQEALRRVSSDAARREAPAEAGGAEPPHEGPVALLAFHGMGQQVRYGTIEETIGIVKSAAERRGCRVELKDRRQLPMEDRFLGCAELMVESDSRRVEVHVYEAYWAPLAEGRISTWETFMFLVDAARESALNGRRFSRFLFSTESPPKGEVKVVPRTTILGLILTAMTMGALGVFDLVILAIALSAIMVASEPPWLAPLLPGLVTDYAGAISLVIIATVLFVGVPAALAPLRKSKAARPALRSYSIVANVALKLTAVALCLIAFDIAAQCVFTAAPDFADWLGRKAARLAASPAFQFLFAWKSLFAGLHQSRGFLLALGAVTFAGSSFVRSFIRQYVGDVAIYVSGHKVNRFYETRQAIQKTACEVAHFIYDRKAGAAPLYEQVVFMGHSLGSVIAYDTLNRVLLEDTESAAGRDARSRTKALITYGSPLDKIAFVFRTQRLKDGSLREAMVAALQPLIQDLSARRFPWINVFSTFDWIGGKLDFYDHRPGGEGPFAEYPVDNRRDNYALTPVAAHGEHGDGPCLQCAVLDALLGISAASRPPSAG